MLDENLIPKVTDLTNFSPVSYFHVSKCNLARWIKITIRFVVIDLGHQPIQFCWKSCHFANVSLFRWYLFNTVLSTFLFPLVRLPSSTHTAECTEERCKNIVFQLGLVILELITGQSAEKGGVDLVQWVQEPRFPRSIHKMIDPDLGNSYDPRELNGLLSVARLCIRSLDKTRICTHQILWYLQKKLGMTRK